MLVEMAMGLVIDANGFWNAVEFVVAVVVGTLFLLFLVRVTVFKPRVVRLSDGIKKVGLSYLQLATLAMHVDVPWTEELEQSLFMAIVLVECFGSGTLG